MNSDSVCTPPLHHVYDTHADLRPFSCSIIYRSVAPHAFNVCCMDLLVFKMLRRRAVVCRDGWETSQRWFTSCSALYCKQGETPPRPKVGTLLGSRYQSLGSTGISSPTCLALKINEFEILIWDFASMLTWEPRYEIWMCFFIYISFWQMCMFVSLNAGSKKRWVVGGWFICLQTMPAGTIHVAQTAFSWAPSISSHCSKK